MDLELHNSWEYEKDDWWEWSAYLKGSDLPKVDYVEYILHPSFKKPLRTVTDPDNGFRLDTSGWGTFDLKAIVHLKNGKQQLLTHEIKLEDKPKTGRTDAKT
jgi:transcription initiation factor IIF auxiliary subunit